MRRLGRILLCIAPMLWAANVWADSSDNTVSEDWGLGPKIFVTEMIVGASASWAATNPKSYGASTALLFPLAAAGNPCPAAAWTSFIGAEAIAADTYFMDTSKHNYNYRFWRHVGAWHIFGALLGTVEYFACPDSSSSASSDSSGLSMGLAPTPDGTQLVFNYRY